MKYRIQFDYYHSVQNEPSEDGFAVAYIKWSSEEIELDFIDQMYLYTKPPTDLTKLGHYHSEWMDLGGM